MAVSKFTPEERLARRRAYNKAYRAQHSKRLNALNEEWRKKKGTIYLTPLT